MGGAFSHCYYNDSGMKDALKGTLSILAIVGFWLWIFWDDLHKSQSPESIPHYFSYTVIDLQGDTITGNTWVPSATRDLQIKKIGGASCLVAVYGNRRDVIRCDIKRIIRFTRFANLNLVQ